MCEDNKGTLYAGLSGRTMTVDTGVVEQEPGGVWKSTNVGQSWTPAAEFPAYTRTLNMAYAVMERYTLLQHNARKHLKIMAGQMILTLEQMPTWFAMIVL